MLLKDYDSFRKSYILFENLGSNFYVPGFNFTEVNINDDIIEVFTSIGWSIEFPLENFNNCSSSPDIIVGLFKYILKSKVNPNIDSKIKAITSAEKLDLFMDMDSGTFFNDIEGDLERFGMDNGDLEYIAHNLETFLVSGASDGLSPESVSIFREYLDYLLELIAGILYTYLKYINRDNMLYNTMEDSDEITNSSSDVFVHPIDISKAIKLANKVISKLENVLDVSFGDPIDHKTGRDVGVTTNVVCYKIEDSDISVTCIINPVELKHRTGGNLLAFSILDDLGVIDSEYEYITDFEELVELLVELI